MLVTFLDLLGILSSGLIGLLIMNSIEGEKHFLSEYIIILKDYFNLDDFEIIVTLSIITICIFILKAVTSLVLTRKIFDFLLKTEEKEISFFLENIFCGNYESLNRFNRTHLADIIVRGIPAGVSNFFGHFQIVLVEIFLILMIFVILACINLILALGMMIFFSITVYVTNLKLGPIVHSVNLELTNSRITSNSLLDKYFQLFRFFRIHNKSDFAVNKLVESISTHSYKYSHDMWLQLIPKFVIESSVLFGVLLLIIFANFFSTSLNPYSAVLIFVVSSARIIPSIMRLQASFYTLRGHQYLAEDYFKARKEFNEVKILDTNIGFASGKEKELITRNILLDVNDVTFAYNNSKLPLFENLNLSIGDHKRIAILGPSGSGKSTLADLIMGVLQPKKGSIKIFGKSPSYWQSTSNFLSYLPQETVLLNGDIIDNVAIGVSRINVDYKYLKFILSALNLDHLPMHKNFEYKDDLHELKLSGGEKQRIGIARVLYLKPSLILMDEPTSSLDYNSENMIFDLLENLLPEAKIILISHRLNSIKDFDFVIYLDEGKIITFGRKDYVVSKLQSLNLLEKN
jgi:ABC-type transport system involved in cytochrome bd biosynthesis fused ATPase/permease subunit